MEAEAGLLLREQSEDMSLEELNCTYPSLPPFLPRILSYNMVKPCALQLGLQNFENFNI